jgi:hypothetical protein
MRVAHIFMVHKSPAQLERVLNVLAHKDFDFYIHLDKKVDIQPFEYLSKINQVYFIVNRTVCNWGGFSLVKAIMKCIDQIEASGVKYDFVNLLSAQDFPLKPITYIHDFLSKNIGYSFLSFDTTTDTPWWKKAVTRYSEYHFTDNKFRGVYLFQKLLNYIMPKRKILSVFPQIYGGSKSTWWTISYDAAIYLSTYFKLNPKLAKSLQYTWGCDEIIIATILMNSPYRNKVINENYRYVVFSGDDGHPDFLTMNDYDKLTNSKMLFARKFDPAVDAEVLNKLQSNISAVNML